MGRAYRSYTPTCYYVLFYYYFYTTMSECMIFYGPIVPEINYSILIVSLPGVETRYAYLSTRSLHS